MQNETPVEVTEDTRGTIEQHPAFGMVGISHMHTGGGVRLFGSRLDGHPGVICLRVHRAQRRHTSARDWYFARDLITEVWLSHAQFSEMITTPNTGEGVPCTIRYVTGEGRVPTFAPLENEADKIRAKVEAKAAAIIKDLKDTRARIDTALANAPAKARKAALDEIDTLIRELGSNMPFYVESLRESMAHTVTEAKIEVEAFVSQAVHAAGLQAIAERGPGNLCLTGATEDEP